MKARRHKRVPQGGVIEVLRELYVPFSLQLPPVVSLGSLGTS
jgi:hypothetical protein